MAKYELNVAVKDGLDWTGKAPKYVHFMLVQLGDDMLAAVDKAEVVIAKFGQDDYKFSLRTIQTTTVVEEL